MNKSELLSYFDENGAGSYDTNWENGSWFSDVTRDKEVVLAMVVMSDAQCLLHGPLKDSEFKKDKKVVFTAIDIYRTLWEDEEDYEAGELWDFVDQTLRRDQEVIDEIGEEF